MAQSAVTRKKTREWLYWVVVAVLLFGVYAMVHSVTPGQFIKTGSMSPTMPAGSIVLDLPVSSVHVGDVITVRDPIDGSKVTHRVAAVQSDGTIVTKGDANPTVDTPLAPLKINDVVGKVIFHMEWWRLLIIAVGVIVMIMVARAWFKKDDKKDVRSVTSDELDAPSPASISA